MFAVIFDLTSMPITYIARVLNSGFGIFSSSLILTFVVTLFLSDFGIYTVFSPCKLFFISSILSIDQLLRTTLALQKVFLYFIRRTRLVGTYFLIIFCSLVVHKLCTFSVYTYSGFWVASRPLVFCSTALPFRAWSPFRALFFELTDFQ